MEEIHLGRWQPARHAGGGDAPSTSEMYDAGFESQLVVNNLNAWQRETETENDRLNDAVAKAGGPALVNPWRQRPTVEDRRAAMDQAVGGVVHMPQFMQDKYERQLAELAQSNPELVGLLAPDRMPTKIVSARRKEVEERVSQINERAGLIEAKDIPLVGGVPLVSDLTAGAYNVATNPVDTLASMAGGIHASLYSPADTAANLVGWLSGKATLSYLKNALRSGTSNAAVQAALEPAVQAQRAVAGQEYGIGPAMSNIAGAFGTGMALDVAVRTPVREARRAMGTQGLGGVLRDAPPQLPDVPGARAAPVIDPEVAAKADAGDIGALRQIAETTGAIDDPAIKGALDHAEMTGDLDRAVVRLRDEMRARGAGEIDIGEAEMHTARVLRSVLDPTEPPAARPPEPVQTAAEPLMRAEAQQLRSARDADVSAVLANSDPRVAAIVDAAFDAGIPAVVRSVQKALDTPGEAASASLAREVATLASDPRMLDLVTIHTSADQIAVATAMRRSPDLVDTNVSLGTDHAREARAIAGLEDRAFEMVARGEADPKLAALVAEHVPPGRQAGTIAELMQAGVRDIDEARRAIADLEPGPQVEPAPFRGVDDPMGPEAKARLEAAEARMQPELEAARRAVPEPAAGETLAKAIMQAGAVRRSVETRQAIMDALALASRVLPEGTRVEIPAEPLRDPASGRLLDATSDTTTGDIMLAAYALNPAGRLGHEGLHTLVTRGLISPAEVSLLAEAAAKLPDVFPAERWQMYADAYKDRPNLARLLEEEAAAHLVEAVINKKAKLEPETGAGITGVVDRIKQFLDTVAERLKNWRDGKGWQTAEDLINDILNGEVAKREAIRNWMRQEDMSAVAVRPKFMAAFAGERAATADHAALARAKQMETEGWPRHDILMQTGWFRDPAKNWRFEISDRYAVDLNRDSNVTKMVRDLVTKGGRESGRLEHNFAHKDLFEAYPQLAKLAVERIPATGTVVASYMRRETGLSRVLRSIMGGGTDPKIGLSARADRNSLLHEVQHAIDDIEGAFANVDRADPYHETGYANAPFEKSARAVEHRSDLTDRQRAARPPWFDWGHGEGRRIVPRDATPATPTPAEGPGKRLVTPQEPLTAGVRHNQGPEWTISEIEEMIDTAYERAASAMGEDDKGILNEALSGGYQHWNDFRSLRRELDRLKATPEQRAAAVDLFLKDQDRMRFEQRTGEALYAISDRDTGQSMRRDMDSLGYYSQALEAARGLKQAKGTPEQMLAQLKSAGVKDAEIEATGLRAILEGKPSITRDDIVRHLEANRVGMREVERNRSQSARIEQRQAAHGADITEVLVNGEIAGEYYPEGGRLRVDHADGRTRLVETADAAVAFIAARDDQDSTKWSNYSLDPSNPTYRETVLHLPSNDKAYAAVARSQELRQQLADAIMRGDNATADVLSRELESLDPDGHLRAFGSRQDFTSGHFPEPNIVGHMMTSMTRHDGKPVYTVDQIQSDWGQKLRDGGVRDEAKIADLKAQLAKLPEFDPSKVSDFKNFSTARGLHIGFKYDGTYLTDILPTMASQSAIASAVRSLATPKERKLLESELRTAKASAPGNPLVNTTDQWVNTTLRRAIRQAAEADAAFIAIPHGDTVLSYNPGDASGMRGFYGSRTSEGIVPKNLRKLLEKIDKEAAKPVRVEALETPTDGLVSRAERKMGRNKEDPDQTGFTLFPLTDKVKRSVIDDGQAMFAFAGERAKTADLEALARAKQMDGQGADRTAIWTETGWFRGVDDKWRFEIDDSGAKWAGPAYADMGDRMQVHAPAGDLLSFPELRTAYPASAATPVRYFRYDNRPMPFGGYNRETGEIIVRSVDESLQTPRSTILHEGQHELQTIEGFAGGGKSADFQGRNTEAPGGFGKRYKWTGENPYEMYRRLAGEVEARAVQKRMDMTADQRRSRPPWLDYDVPEDQQIVRFADGAKPDGAMFAIRDQNEPDPQSPLVRDTHDADALNEAAAKLKPEPPKADSAPQMFAIRDPGTVIDELLDRHVIGHAAAADYKKRLERFQRSGMTVDQAIGQLVADLQASAQMKRANAVLAETKRQTLVDDLQRYRNHKGEANVLEAFRRIHERFDTTGAYIADVANAEDAISKRVHSLIGGALQEFRKGAITGDLRRRLPWVAARMDNVGKAIMGEKVTNDPTAEAIAKTLSDVFDTEIRQRFNAAGGHIGKLDYGWLPTAWNGDAVHNYVRKYGLEHRRRPDTPSFVESVIEHVDWTRTVSPLNGRQFTPEERVEAIVASAKNIMTDGQLDAEINSAPPGRGAVYTQHAEHRFFHWKDYAAWKRVMSDFGSADLYAGFMGHLKVMARDIAHMERLGPNPNVMRQYLKNWIMARAKSVVTIDTLIDDHRDRMAQVAKRLQIDNPEYLKLQDDLYDTLRELDRARTHPAWTLAGFATAATGMRARGAEMIKQWETKLTGIYDRLMEIRKGLDATPEKLDNPEAIAEFTALIEEVRTPVAFAAKNDPVSYATAHLLKTDAMWSHMRGALTPVNSTAASVGAGTRNLIASTTLGAAAISSISDAGNAQTQRLRWAMSLGRSNAANVLRQTIGRLAKSGAADFLPGRLAVDPRWEGVASSLGLDSALNVWQAESRFVGAVDTRGWTGFLADRTLSLGLLSPMTQSAKHLHGVMLQQWLAEAVTTPWTDLPAQIRDNLAAHGFNVASWSKLQTVPLYDPQTGAPATDGSRVRQLRPAEIEAAHGRELAERYIAMVARDTRLAVLESTVESRATVLGETRPGTITGEAMRAFGQLKSFPIAVAMLQIGRVQRHLAAGQITGNGALQAGAFLISSAMLGALAMALKDMKDGRDPRRWRDEEAWLKWDMWAAAMLQSGGLGIYGDLLFSNVNRHGGGLASTIGGPMVDRIDNIRELTIGNMIQAYQGKETNVGREISRFAKSNTPVVGSLWYTSLAYERVFVRQLQELTDPKAHQAWQTAIRNRYRDYGGQEHWWRPGESRPDRAPDISRVWATQ